MDNIYVRMSGRLGNQLFRYAAARYIQEISGGGRLFFDFSVVYKEGKAKPTESGFENALKYFKVKKYQTESATVLEPFKGNLCQKIRFVISLLLLRTVGPQNKTFNAFNYENFNRGLYITIGQPEYHEIKKINIRDKFVYGRFEDPRYFDKIYNLLLDEIQPIEAERSENLYLYEILKSEKETVCMSIRRGDYVTNPEVGKALNICTKQYFERAVEYIKKAVSNPIFIVFSDDIEWCKENIDFIEKDKCFFETGKDPVWEKLRLMYLCKHFIISNSTFSWWAQYLSRNKDKIVIAPRRWLNDADGENYPLLLDSFVKL